MTNKLLGGTFEKEILSWHVDFAVFDTHWFRIGLKRAQDEVHLIGLLVEDILLRD